MKPRRKTPTPEQRCTQLYPSGQQCRQWKARGYDTCGSNTTEILQKSIKNRTPGISLKSQRAYKNGTRAAPLKPLRQKEDLLDHLFLKHFEIYLAAEAASEEENLRELARHSTKLIRVTPATSKNKPLPNSSFITHPSSFRLCPLPFNPLPKPVLSQSKDPLTAPIR